MRIVKISDLSEEERKKAFEKQEERYRINEEARKAERERVNKLVEEEFDKLSDSSYKNNKEKTSLKKIGTSASGIGGNFLMGIESTLPKVADYTNYMFKYATKKAGEKYLKKALEKTGLSEDKRDIISNAVGDVVFKPMADKLSNYTDLGKVDKELNSEKMKKWRNETIQKNTLKAQEGGEVGKFANDVALGIGQNVLPMAVTALPGGQLAGASLFMASSGGSYLEDAEQRGMNEDEKAGYATVMGMWEGGFDYATAGLAGKTLKLAGAGEILTKQGIKNSIYEILLNGVQEGITEPANEYVASLSSSDNNLGERLQGKGKYANWENMPQRILRSAGTGMASGIIMDGAGKGIGSAVYANNVNQSTQQAVKKAEQQLGRKITDEETKNIQEQVKKQVKFQMTDTVNMTKEEREEIEKLSQMSYEDMLLSAIESTVESGKVNVEEVAKGVNKALKEQTQITQNQLPVINPKNTYSNKLKQTALEEINNSNISSSEKQLMIDSLNKVENITDADIEAIRQTINTANELETENNKLNANGNYKYDQARKQKYMQYKNDNNAYDNSAVNEVLEVTPTNRNGRRTVKQWLQVANEIGTRIANKSNAEIEEIAYKSWFEVQPNKSITQYDNQTKSNVGFQKFTSDEWINTINNAVNEARSNQFEQKNQSEILQNQVLEQTNNAINNQEIPIEGYQYEESNNVKINNLRQDANRYFDNSEKTRNYVNMLEKIITDKDIEIRLDANLKTADGRIANGSYLNGVITINPNSSRAGEFIAIHELTHAIGTKEMINMVNTYRESNAEFDSAVKGLLQNYDGEVISEEALADIAGQLFGNQEFINNIAQNNPNIFQRIYSEIKYLWHQFRGYKNQDQFIEDLYFKWEQAYRNNNRLNEITKYSIAGRKSLENIKDNAMLYNSGISSYYQAQQMANQNISNEQIRKRTGWFQDKNGDWKYEFSDKDMAIKDNIVLESNKIYELGKILKHDTLFELYPELKQLSVKVDDVNKISGNYNKNSKTITLSSKLLNKRKMLEGTLIHELQHAIQDIEGFEKGTSSKFSKDRYYNSLGEIEADNTRKRFIDEKYNNKDITTEAPESSKANPKHRNYDNYINNRTTLDKVKDGMFKYFKGLGDSNEIVQENNQENIQQDIRLVDDGRNGRHVSKGDSNEIIQKNLEQADEETLRYNNGQVWNRLNDNTKESENNLDIRYSISEDTDIDTKINASMTMEDARKMIQLAFNDNNIEEWYDGKYKNGDEWLEGEGVDDIVMYVENTESSITKYLNPLGAKDSSYYNGDYTLDDIIEAYKNKTLTGEQKQSRKNLDTSVDTGFIDNRFYAPQNIELTKELYDKASQRITSKNKQEIYKARADFIIATHNPNAIENLGLDIKEVNKKLRDWSAYTKEARELSQRFNDGVARQNQWSGLENSSLVNKISVSSEQMESLVKEIKGNSSDWQRDYITSTMLAIDTHIDYTNLTFEFDKTAELRKNNANGDYDYTTDTIRIGDAEQNTVAHEMGHYIDHQWAREIFGNNVMPLSERAYSNNLNYNLTNEQKLFIDNFRNFIKDISDSATLGNKYSKRNGSYWQRNTEVFARFIAEFTEWVKNKATNNRYSYERERYGNPFGDNFTESQYKEFVNILQEKSMLDTTKKVKYSVSEASTDNQKSKSWQEYLDENYKPTGTRTNLQKILPSAKNNILATGEYTNNVQEKDNEEMIAQILKESPTEENKKSRFWAIAKANILDKGIVFEELSQKTKNRNLQGKWDYTLTAMSRGQNAIGKDRYEFDSINKKEKIISKSLESIRSEVGNNIEKFSNYMYHKLNIDRMTLEERFGVDNKPVFAKGITAEISERIVNEYEQKNPKFKEWAKDIYDYNKANKKELVNNGVISQELADLLDERYPHYVPIARANKRGNAIKVPLDTGRTGINTPLARAKGGNSDILPLFDTLAKRTLQTYNASARNNFGVELKNTLKSFQEKEKVDIDNIVDEIGNEQEELLKEGKNGNNPTFTVFDNGEKVTFEITKDMYDALKPINDSSLLNKMWFGGVPNKISNFRRAVLTEYNPIFSLTNPIKDMQDVLINSQHATKTYSKFPESIAQIAKKGYWYKEYIQNGGEQNSYFNTQDNKFASEKKESLPKKIATFPLKAISSINKTIEMTPRLAEYIASRENGRNIETSMLDASRVTTNFKAGGDITKALNRNGATFLNASVQGAMQQVRNIKEANIKGAKGYAVLASKYIVAGLPAILLNNIIWSDDDDYEELQDYVKDNYYIVAKYGEGKFVRIPKGRTVAVVQKMVSDVSKYINGKNELNIDNVAKDFWGNISFARDNLAPNNPLDNNVLSPIIQVATNKSWYGEDIVPSRLQNKPKAEQYDESTDSLSKWLGEKLNQSPYKINYLLDQYGGGISDVALPMMTKQAENNVLEDKFTTDSVMKNKYPGEFYEKLEEITIKGNSDKASDEDILKSKYANEVSKNMSELYKEKREIQNSDLTDKEKKRKLKEVQTQINKIAKDGLENVKQIEVSGNVTKIGDNQYYKTINLEEEYEWKKVSDEEKNKNKDISLKTYADYKEKIAKETIKQRKNGYLENDGSLKNKDKISILIKNNYTNKEKQAIYENYIKSKTDNKYEIVKATGLNINSYLKYKLAESNNEFASDKKDDGTVKGKSVTNSAKNKKYNYINSMQNTTYIQKAVLFGLEYSPEKTDKNTIVNYITSLPGKTDKEKLDMLSEFSWIKIYKDGTFSY